MELHAPTAPRTDRADIRDQSGLLFEFLFSKMPWRARGACSGQGELFFNPAKAKQREAAAICAECPVRAECRSWAIENPGKASHGVWGGLTEKQRESARRRARRY